MRYLALIHADEERWSALPEDERQATRSAMEENVALFRNEDGTYSAPGSAWGVLTR